MVEFYQCLDVKVCITVCESLYEHCFVPNEGPFYPNVVAVIETVCGGYH